MAIKDIAKRIDVSVRTVYRDLTAIEGEIGIGVWSDGGRWGLAADEFLPPLKLTQDEAMAVVLSARLMVRYADKYDPDLASAFEKLGEVLPPALGEHVARTLDVLSRHPTDERFSRHVSLLTKAWAERRVVSLDYEPARYGPDSAPRDRPRPAVPDRAVAPDPRAVPDRLGRDARTRSGRSRSSGSGTSSITPRDVRPAGGRASSRRCSTGPGTSSPTRSRSRSCSASRRRSPRASRRRAGTRSQRVDGRGRRLAPLAGTVAGTIEVRLWVLQWGDDVGGRRAGIAARRRCGDPSTRARPLRSRPTGTDAGPPPVRRRQPDQRPDPRLRRADEAAGARRGRAPPGLPAEDAAEEDLLDTAWLQRLRRISQLQSARWVFPTAEHSRFTHGLGRHARGGRLGPVAVPVACARRSGAARPSRCRPRASSSRRCGSPASSTTSATGRSPTSSTTTSWRRSRRRPTTAGTAGKRLTHEDLSQVIVERELGPLIRGPAAGARERSRSGTPSPTASRSTRAGSRSSSRSRPSPTRRCRAGSAGCSRSCRASSRSTTSTTSGATPT